MFNAHVAAFRFQQRDAALWNHYRHGAPAPDDAALGFRHGWIVLEGQSFPREAVMANAAAYRGAY